MTRSILAVTVLGAGLALAVGAHAQPPAGQKPHGGSHGGHMEHRFDDPARFAKSFDDPARDAWQMPERVIEALGLQAGQSVADVGAGTGYFTVRLAKSPAAPRVYAADVEASMVEWVRQRAVKEQLTNVVAIQASAASPNLPEAVDVVLIVNTYHHIPDRETYFRSLLRSLKPGGRLAIVDFQRGAPMGPPEEFRFPPAQIEAELSRAGYTLATRHDFLPHQLFLVFRAR